MLFFLRACFLFIGVVSYFNKSVIFIEWEICQFLRSSVVILFLFDWTSISFAGLVILISSIVMFYSLEYMSGDKHLYRFILLVYLFVLSIIIIIVSPNIIRILLGWDGLGLVSYCLVIYYQNVKSSAAGIVTILSNRIGDVAILLTIAWLLNFGSWNLFYAQFIYSYKDIIFVIVLVVLAAITKRAQMPFSAWLPAAIAAPTPVSALVHSSTLVTAGVYLLIRFNYILGVRNFLFFIGLLTIFISGLGANFETDLKKIIALSTLRQLGLIIITLGLGLYELAFFHLLTHAIFKSLLFLCAGVFIHSMGDTQDIRHIGGLMISCPVTSFYFIGSSFALCGFPFLSGFYSKDLILEFYAIGVLNFFMYVLVILATLFTLTYSTRLMYYTFFNNLGVKRFLNLGETSLMLSPMSVLIVYSVFIGGYIRIFIFPTILIFLPLFLKVLILALLIILFVYLINYMNLKLINSVNYTGQFVYYLGSMWFLPFLTTLFFIPLLKVGSDVIKTVDQGWAEHLGGQGVLFKSKFFTSQLDKFNVLNIKIYIYLFIVLTVFLLFMVVSYLNSLKLKHHIEAVRINLHFLNMSD